jgi:hypothetical protein
MIFLTSLCFIASPGEKTHHEDWKSVVLQPGRAVCGEKMVCFLKILVSESILEKDLTNSDCSYLETVS